MIPLTQHLEPLRLASWHSVLALLRFSRIFDNNEIFVIKSGNSVIISLEGMQYGVM